MELIKLSEYNVKEAVQLLATDVNEGNVDYNQFVRLRKLFIVMDKFFKNKEVKQFQEIEAAKYNKDNLHGLNISVSNRSKYEYEQCNHTALNVAYKALKELKQYIAEQESILKTVKEPVEFIINHTPNLLWEESGEITTLIPPTVSMTQYVSYKE